jgi:CRP-like cAMP-binding protein
MEGLERIVREHPFFCGMPAAYSDLVCGCAKNARFSAGQYLFHEGEPADWFYLLRSGRVALELTAPGRGRVTFQRVPQGEIVGVSWLIPPWRWTYDARAIEDTRAIAVNAACLRQKCDADHDLGLVGTFHFLTLRTSARMLAAGSALATGVALHVVRFAVTAAALTFIARHGALPLITVTLGVTAARTAVLKFG